MKKNLFIVTFAICILMTSFVFAGWFTGHATRGVTVYTASEDRTFVLGGKTYQIKNLGPYQNNNDQVYFSIEAEGGSPAKTCDGIAEDGICDASDLGLEIKVLRIGHYIFGSKRGEISNIRLSVTEIEGDNPVDAEVETDCTRTSPCAIGGSCNHDYECESLYCKNRVCTALPDTWVCEEVEDRLKLTAKNPDNPRLAPRVYYRDKKECTGNVLEVRKCVSGISVKEPASSAYEIESETNCPNGCYEFGVGSHLANCRSSTDDESDGSNSGSQEADEIIEEIETLLAQLKNLM